MTIHPIRILIILILLGNSLNLFPSPKDTDAALKVEALLGSMKEEEILGQLFLVGYPGAEPTPLLLEWIRTRGLGGVKIFGWNTDDLQVLNRSIHRMQRESKKSRMQIPLFIATDQEGGWVRHVRGDTSITPGNLALGATRFPIDAYRTGYYIGRELKALGINMNFAPTVDVYVNPEVHVIGPRAFSSDPVLTGILGVAFYRGLEKAGVIAAAKHFPGHGNADKDSHVALPIIYDTFETLWQRDLLPYRMLIAEGIPALLSGHLNFPKITNNRLPSSLCSFFNIEVLRNRLGFRGLLITDDLYMTGAKRGNPIEEVSVEAVAAGNDVIMLSRTPRLDDPIWRAITQRYRRDTAFRNRVLESVRRILKVKVQYLDFDKDLSTPPKDEIPPAIGNPDVQNFFLEQAARSVTMLRDTRSMLPFTPAANERVLLAGPFRDFLSIGKRFFPQAEEFRFSFSPFFRSNPKERIAFQRKAAEADTIIFCLANPNGLELLKTLSAFRGRILVFSVLTPVYLREVPWVQTAIAVYGWGTESFEAGFSFLVGDIPALGENPIVPLLSGGEP